jgi:hypothetical protein
MNWTRLLVVVGALTALIIFGISFGTQFIMGDP